MPCGNCDKGMVRDRFETWVVCPLCKGWRYYSVRPTPKANPFKPMKAQSKLFSDQVGMDPHYVVGGYCYKTTHTPIDWDLTQTEIDYLNGIVRD